MFQAYRLSIPATVGDGVGCTACGGSGFKGRNAVTEILPVSPEVAKLIASGAGTDAVKHEGYKWGYVPMQIRVLKLIAAGKTTLEEASRVVFLDDQFGLDVTRQEAA